MEGDIHKLAISTTYSFKHKISLLLVKVFIYSSDSPCWVSIQTLSKSGNNQRHLSRSLNFLLLISLCHKSHATKTYISSFSVRFFFQFSCKVLFTYTSSSKKRKKKQWLLSPSGVLQWWVAMGGPPAAKIDAEGSVKADALEERLGVHLAKSPSISSLWFKE